MRIPLIAWTSSISISQATARLQLVRTIIHSQSSTSLTSSSNIRRTAADQQPLTLRTSSALLLTGNTLQRPRRRRRRRRQQQPASSPSSSPLPTRSRPSHPLASYKTQDIPRPRRSFSQLNSPTDQRRRVDSSAPPNSHHLSFPLSNKPKRTSGIAFCISSCRLFSTTSPSATAQTCSLISKTPPASQQRQSNKARAGRGIIPRSGVYNYHDRGRLGPAVVPPSTSTTSARRTLEAPSTSSTVFLGHKIRRAAVASHHFGRQEQERQRHLRPVTATSLSCLSAAMATLSQPNTPANPDSPLRDSRERPIQRLTDNLETPSLDDRQYRVIRLPNDLEVLLVHDGETDKASAAMDVNVGNFSDPEDLPGLAHCVEHMLFMGTKKVRRLLLFHSPSIIFRVALLDGHLSPSMCWVKCSL